MFDIGEEIEIKGQPFILCDIKNNRLVLCPKVAPLTMREKRNLEKKKSAIIQDGSLVCGKRRVRI